MIPLEGESCSQLPPFSVVAVAVQLMAPCPMLRMPKFCASGMPPCATAVKLKALWESSMVAAGALTDRVTGTVLLLPPPVIVTAPLYVPAASVPRSEEHTSELQ